MFYFLDVQLVDISFCVTPLPWTDDGMKFQIYKLTMHGPITTPAANPGFSKGERQPLAGRQPIILPIFPRKLHEYEEILPRGGGASSPSLSSANEHL